MDTETKAKEYDKIMEKSDKTGVVSTALNNALDRMSTTLQKEGKDKSIPPAVHILILLMSAIEGEGIYDDIVKGIQ